MKIFFERKNGNQEGESRDEAITVAATDDSKTFCQKRAHILTLLQFSS